MGETDSLAVKALVEANGLLRDTIARHRRTNVKLRTIIRKLRQQHSALIATAQENDEEFLASCEKEIYEHGTDEGGFPESVSS